MRSRRRGLGLDLAGARPYRAGDDIRAIDHRASARRSSVTGNDELVVREYLTEESTQVAIIVDRRASMALFPAGLPWLSKPRAVASAVRLISDSAREARCPVSILDYEDGHRWRLPEAPAEDHPETEPDSQAFDAPPSSLDEALFAALRRDRPLASGAFLFILSDFICPPSAAGWDAVLSRGLDVVPLVIQDPIWEQSFPDVAGTTVAFTDADGSTGRRVRLTRNEVEQRRSANEQRFAELTRTLELLALDRVVLGDHRSGEVVRALSSWVEGRRDGARFIR
ncbi:MAG: DUF58 domain-containing protein [Gaiellales bacterium]